MMKCSLEAPRPVIRCIVLTLSILTLVLLAFEMSDWDVALQDHLYDFTNRHWITEPYQPGLQLWLHKYLKWGLIGIGILALLFVGAGFIYPALAPKKFRLLFLVACMALVPAIIAGGKHVTNTYCPNQTERYNGPYPYIKVLESYPESFVQPKPGICFPAGHATLGFAFMALFFVVPWRYRWAGLATGLGLGWLMGFYQMAKGAHFLSHTLVTMLGAWALILVVYALFKNRKWL